MKLKPCPFCGMVGSVKFAPAFTVVRRPKNVRVWCSWHHEGCGSRGPEMTTRKDAAKHWNERAAV